MTFLAYTDLRWREMAALRVQEVVSLRARMHIARSVTENNGWLVFDTTKTGAARTQPLPRFLADEMLTAMAGKSPAELVFEGRPWKCPSARQLRSPPFAPAAAAIGVPDLTPHGLRHTATSLGINAGANVKVVHQMLGHATPSMTLDLYGHLFPDQLDDVAVRLDQVRSEAAADYLRTSGTVTPLRSGAAGVRPAAIPVGPAGLEPTTAAV